MYYSNESVTMKIRCLSIYLIHVYFGLFCLHRRFAFNEVEKFDSRIKIISFVDLFNFANVYL